MKFRNKVLDVVAGIGARRDFMRCSASLALLAIVPASLALRKVVASPKATLVPPARARGPSRIDVRDKGAAGDGKHDDTAAFQAAIDALPPAGGTVHVPAGSYLIDAVASVLLRSRMHLELAPDAKLLAIPNGEKKGYVLYAYKVADVEISGGQIIGERAKHLGTEGEWGHGIQIRGASGVTVRNIRISDCWGDGVCIGGSDLHQSTPSEDIVLASIISTGNRRQGLSIGRSRNVRVHDSEFSDTAGTSPQCGIDIEPDRPGGTDNVHIENCVIRNNRGGGIQIFKRVTTVTVEGCIIEGNRGHGILAVAAHGGLITNNRIDGNGLVGVVMREQTSDFQVRGNRFDNNDTRLRRPRAKVQGNKSSAAINITGDTSAIQVSDNVINQQ